MPWPSQKGTALAALGTVVLLNHKLLTVHALTTSYLVPYTTRVNCLHITSHDADRPIGTGRHQVCVCSPPALIKHTPDPGLFEVSSPAPCAVVISGGAALIKHGRQGLCERAVWCRPGPRVEVGRGRPVMGCQGVNQKHRNDRMAAAHASDTSACKTNPHPVVQTPKTAFTRKSSTCLLIFYIKNMFH